MQIYAHSMYVSINSGVYVRVSVCMYVYMRVCKYVVCVGSLNVAATFPKAASPCVEVRQPRPHLAHTCTSLAR